MFCALLGLLQRFTPCNDGSKMSLLTKTRQSLPATLINDNRRPAAVLSHIYYIYCVRNLSLIGAVLFLEDTLKSYIKEQHIN